jgi:hypothetical protein
MARKSASNPMSTDEGREQQLIALAIDCAEEQLLSGKASSQVITHYLKLGSTREKLEKEIMEKQKQLMEAKTEALQSNKHIEELYAKAIEQMQIYAGREPKEDFYE